MMAAPTNAFASRANDDLVAWKHRTPTLDGADCAAAPYSKRPAGPVYDVCLPLDHAAHNLLPDAREIALDRFARLGIRWHDGWQSGPSNHLRSSQVQCVNALMPFVDDPQSLAAIFGSVLPIETVLPCGDPGAPDDHVVFELIGLVDYLNEWNGKLPTRGANVTSLDAAIRYVASDSAIEIALIEWKYTESYLSVSPKHDAAKNATRRKRYENLWGSVVRTDLLDLDDLFVEPIYQMLRQQMLAHEMEQAHELGADRVRVVYAAPAANTELWTSIANSELRSVGRDDIRELWDTLRLVPDRFTWLDTAALVAPDTPTSTEFKDRYAHLDAEGESGS